nr:MAG TPA: hypothetical protein [Caudoviricetes sp.]
MVIGNVLFNGYGVLQLTLILMVMVQFHSLVVIM